MHISFGNIYLWGFAYLSNVGDKVIVPELLNHIDPVGEI